MRALQLLHEKVDSACYVRDQRDIDERGDISSAAKKLFCLKLQVTAFENF